MAKKRRTRRQKIAARSKAIVYSLPKQAKRIKNKAVRSEKTVFFYDPGLIRSDLTKTAVLSILAVATIVVIYFLKII